MNYASSITGSDIEPVRISEGIEVEKKDVNKEDLFKTLVTDLFKLKEKGLNRICIITKSSNEANAIYEGLKDELEGITIINDDNDSLEKDILLSPSYISKGLEFDAVINYNDKENDYEDKDKYLYYIASTRAQHSLTIYNEPQKVMKKER
jgi:DNA helicase-2/ATP-dependent DNA helicase PcrA